MTKKTVILIGMVGFFDLNLDLVLIAYHVGGARGITSSSHL